MSAQVFQPREYQAPIIDAILDIERVGIWCGMGGGKTVSTGTAISHLALVEDVLPVLVIAPKRVALSTWPNEFEKWTHLSHLRVSPIIGTPKERLAALYRKAEVYTINYDNLVWLVETVGKNWPFRMVVADESTRLKGFRLGQGGKRTRALAKVAHSKVSRFVQLTGTPAANGLKDLWGQAWFLDKGERLGRTYGAFTQRWFTQIPTGAGFSIIEPLPHAQEQIQAALADICLSINPGDYMDISEPIMHTVEVELPAKARRLYDAMEKEMFTQIGEHEVEAFTSATKTMKCLQLASGAAYVGEDSSEWVEVHDTKLQALESIVEEAAGMPVLVAYHFKSDLARLKKAFPQGRHLDDNPQTERDWNAGKIPLLFAHPASAGHGLNLQDGGNILTFFSHWWDLEQYQQIIERIGPTRQLQAGHDRPVYIYHIVAKDTVDEIVMQRRESKRDVQDLLMEAMKRRSK